MTYGQLLNDAVAALRAATRLARRSRAANHAQAAGVLAERDRVLRGLIRLTSLLEAATPPQPSTRTTTPDLPSNATLLLRALEHARPAVPAHADLPRPPALHRRLATAATSLHVAADILASHIDPANGPRTPEGAAIRLGAGRAEALTDLAHLAAAVATVDTRLVRWLGGDDPMPPSPAAGHAAAIGTMYAWLTGLDRTAIAVVAESSHGQSVLRHLTVATPDTNAGAARTPTSITECAAVIDDLGMWLFRQPEQVEGYHLAAATRLGQLASVVAWRQGLPGPRAPALIGWRTAALAVGHVAAPPPSHPDVRLTEMDHAADFLRATPPEPASLAPLRQRLPRLAAAVRAATERAVRRGVIFTRHTALQATPGDGGVYRTVARWARAVPADPTVKQLLGGLSQASAPAFRTSADTTVGAQPGRGFPPLRAIQATTPPTPPPRELPPMSPMRRPRI